MGIPPNKCHYGGYDHTITRILKRMTVTLICGYSRSCSVCHNDPSDAPYAVPLGIGIKSYVAVQVINRNRITFSATFAASAVQH